MLQILGVDAIDRVLFGILSGLYRSIARVYDIMINLIQGEYDSYKPALDAIGKFTTTIYVLAGVFMLFRVTISLINMLIEPDKINDRQAGTGKVLTRIVTSLLMLILFVPNGWIFAEETGILARLEKAVVGPEGVTEGVIYNLIPIKNNSNANNDITTLISDNVYADNHSSGGHRVNEGYSSKYMECYYAYLIFREKKSGSTTTPAPSFNIDRGYLHVTFYNNMADQHDGTKRLCVNGTKDCDKYSYIFKYDDKYYKAPNGGTISDNKNVFGNGWPTECPKLINASGVIQKYRSNKGLQGYFGGYHTKEQLDEYLAQKKVEHAYSPSGQDTSDLDKDLKETHDDYWNEVASVKLIYVDHPEALSLAQHSLGAFISCKDGDDECNKLKYGKDEDHPETGMLADAETKATVIDKINNEEIDMDFMIGVVAGVGLFVWIVFLCVDVLIRRFKIILLKMIAPIPIISYSDPNDKMFNQWGKMYVSTYIDLFLKLFAISFAIALLKQISSQVELGLVTFFYIIAILIFAKAIPDMLSNIFGIKVSTGSFKDIMGKNGYIRKGLGLGAGAVAGGVAGIATGVSTFRSSKGQGFGNRLLEGVRGTKNAFNGIFQGAGSGFNGNVLGGAKNVASINASTRSKYASGLKASHLLEAATLGKVGMDKASRIDRELEKDIAKRDKIMKLTKYQGEITKLARDGGLMKQVQSAKLNGLSLDSAAEQELAIQYAEAMRSGESAASFKARMTDSTQTPYAATFQRLFSDSRFSEQTTEHISGYNWRNEDDFQSGNFIGAINDAVNKGYNLDATAKRYLENQYGEALSNGESAASFKTRMENDANYGEQYKNFFADKKFSDERTITISGFDWDNKDSFVDGGVKAQIQGVVDSFNYDITRSPSLGDVVGKKQIETVFDVKEANLGAWNGVATTDKDGNVTRTEGVNALNRRINDKINTPEYAAAKAANGSGNSDNSSK